MKRLIRYGIWLPLALVLVTLALANRAPVALHAFSDDLAAFAGFQLSIEVPLFLVIFASILIGLLIGFVWEWAREHTIRSAARRSSKEVSKLERELAGLRSAAPKDDILALLDSPKAK